MEFASRIDYNDQSAGEWPSPQEVQIINYGKMYFDDKVYFKGKINYTAQFSFSFDNSKGLINNGTIEDGAVLLIMDGIYTPRTDNDTYIRYSFVEGIDKKMENISFPGFGIIKNAGSVHNGVGGDKVADIWIDKQGKLHRRSLVSFVSNGGTGEMDEIPVSTGLPYFLPECTFSAPLGKKFAGWQINDTVYKANDQITVTQDIIAKAIWENVIINDDDETKVDVENLDVVPQELGQYFSTIALLKQRMFEFIHRQKNIFNLANTKFMDIKLLVKVNGVWVEATIDNFPKEGIRVRLDYPEGTNSKDYVFAVSHMFAHESVRLGIRPGQVEMPPVTLKPDGIWVTLHGLSPVAISWANVEENSDETLPQTGDSSNLLSYILLCGLSVMVVVSLMIRKRKMS